MRGTVIHSAFNTVCHTPATVTCAGLRHNNNIMRRRPLMNVLIGIIVDGPDWLLNRVMHTDGKER